MKIMLIIQLWMCVCLGIYIKLLGYGEWRD